MKMTHKTLVQLCAEGSFSTIVKRLLRSPEAVYRNDFEQEIEKIKLAYELTPVRTFASKILLGTYKLMIDKYHHAFGREFDNVLHKRIQQDLKDLQVLNRYRGNKLDIR